MDPTKSNVARDVINWVHDNPNKGKTIMNGIKNFISNDSVEGQKILTAIGEVIIQDRKDDPVARRVSSLFEQITTASGEEKTKLYKEMAKEIEGGLGKWHELGAKGTVETGLKRYISKNPKTCLKLLNAISNNVILKRVKDHNSPEQVVSRQPTYREIQSLDIIKNPITLDALKNYKHNALTPEILHDDDAEILAVSIGELTKPQSEEEFEALLMLDREAIPRPTFTGTELFGQLSLTNKFIALSFMDELGAGKDKCLEILRYNIENANEGDYDTKVLEQYLSKIIKERDFPKLQAFEELIPSVPPFLRDKIIKAVDESMKTIRVENQEVKELKPGRVASEEVSQRAMEVENDVPKELEVIRTKLMHATNVEHDVPKELGAKLMHATNVEHDVPEQFEVVERGKSKPIRAKEVEQDIPEEFDVQSDYKQ